MKTRARQRDRIKALILSTACIGMAFLSASCGGGGSTAIVPVSAAAGSNPQPSLTSLSPSSAYPGAAAQTLTLIGTNFLSTSTVTYNGAGHAATFVSSTQLTIGLTAADEATAGSYAVVVTNPGPGGGASNALNFLVTTNNPVPTITSLSPASALVGAAAETLTIKGTNFLSTSTVTYNGAGHAATFVSSTQLTIGLTAADEATAGSYAVVVTNPGPGGGASNALNFLVTTNNPVPTITSLSPASALVGAAAETLTIKGTNFLSTSTVTYNGAGHAATFVSSTQLTIGLTAADEATAGSYAVVVTNPGPGGGASNALNFLVTTNNPVPTITSLSPASALVGAAAETLTIKGTNFLSTSTVTYNGAGHAATFVSSTQLTIGLTAADEATAGSYAVVVTNPGPGGGASNAVNFTVTGGVPEASLSPSTVTFVPPSPLAGQPVLTTAGAESVTLTNTGNAILTVAGVPEITGNNPLDFTLNTTCGSSLGTSSSNDTCTTVVTFTPTDFNCSSSPTYCTTARTASLAITDNNNNVAGSTQQVTLTGTAIHDVILTATETVPGVTYDVYRGTTPGGEGTTPQLTCTSFSGTSCVNTAVSTGVTYCYKIAAVSSGVVSSTSAEVCTPTPIPPP